MGFTVEDRFNCTPANIIDDVEGLTHLARKENDRLSVANGKLPDVSIYLGLTVNRISHCYQ